MSKAPHFLQINQIFDLWEGVEQHESVLDPDLLVGLKALLLGVLVGQGWTNLDKDLMRWSEVWTALDQGRGWTNTAHAGEDDNSAFEAASQELAGTPARGGPEAMRRSYIKIQQRLPLEKRRQRTYRRRNAH